MSLISMEGLEHKNVVVTEDVFEQMYAEGKASELVLSGTMGLASGRLISGRGLANLASEVKKLDDLHVLQKKLLDYSLDHFVVRLQGLPRGDAPRGEISRGSHHNYRRCTKGIYRSDFSPKLSPEIMAANPHFRTSPVMESVLQEQHGRVDEEWYVLLNELFADGIRIETFLPSHEQVKKQLIHILLLARVHHHVKKL